MLGWDISVYRNDSGAGTDEVGEWIEGNRLASWRGEVEALRWIDELVVQGAGTNLGGDGYPYRYAVRAGRLLDAIANGLPYLKASQSPSTTPESPLIDITAHTRDCQPDEWLLIIAWDLS